MSEKNTLSQKQLQEIVEAYDKSYQPKLSECIAKLFSAAHTLHIVSGLEVVIDVQGARTEFKNAAPNNLYEEQE